MSSIQGKDTTDLSDDVCVDDFRQYSIARVSQSRHPHYKCLAALQTAHAPDPACLYDIKGSGLGIECAFPLRGPLASIDSMLLH